MTIGKTDEGEEFEVSVNFNADAATGPQSYRANSNWDDGPLG